MNTDEKGGRETRPTTVVRWCLMAALVFLLAGCKAELYHGLSEQSANEMVVTLEQHGIQASKQQDPIEPELYMVTVPSGVKVDAWRVLEIQGLPRPKVEGFGAFYPSEGLVPTSNEERVVLQYATAQELRDSILAIDGIVDARVNLVLPEKSRVRLSSEKVSPPRASVLVKYKEIEGKLPVSEEAVQRLISGGVENLAAGDVTVIMTPIADSTRPLEAPKLAQVGPVSVAPSNKTMLQGLIVGMIAIIGFLAGAVIFLLVKRRGA